MGWSCLLPKVLAHCWSKVSSTCLLVLTHNIMPDGFDDTHMGLIPKKQPVESMGDLRPISLCNVI